MTTPWKDEIIRFLDAYNECFLLKDTRKLREFYDDESGVLIYLDNHKNNDTYDLPGHLKLLDRFFTEGKKTESGAVEPITVENLHILGHGDSACLCFTARYKSFPIPAIRCTFYIEKRKNKWKILHAHNSFEPEK